MRRSASRRTSSRPCCSRSPCACRRAARRARTPSGKKSAASLKRAKLTLPGTGGSFGRRPGHSWRRLPMAHYMFEAAFTAEAWSKMVSKPQDRSKVVGQMMEKLGGRLQNYFLAFGEYDAVVIVELPDNVSAAAAAVSAASGGGIKAIRTTPLMTVEEGMQVMRKAAASGYRPPS